MEGTQECLHNAWVTGGILRWIAFELWHKERINFYKIDEVTVSNIRKNST